MYVYIVWLEEMVSDRTMLTHVVSFHTMSLRTIYLHYKTI